MEKSNKQNSNGTELSLTSEITIETLSKLTGMSRQTVSSKLEALGIPYTTKTRGKRYYSLADLLKNTLQKLNKEPDDIENDKKRLAKAKADLAEIELGQKRNELLPTALILSEITEEYSLVRAQLRSLGRMTALSLAQSQDANECADIVSQAVEQVLANLTADSQQNLIEATTAQQIIDEEETEDESV